jgi:hypothetical protein
MTPILSFSCACAALSGSRQAVAAAMIAVLMFSLFSVMPFLILSPDACEP